MTGTGVVRAFATFTLLLTSLTLAYGCCPTTPVIPHDGDDAMAADGVLPRCRLAPQPAAFTATAEAAFARTLARHPLPFSSLQINPVKANSSALALYVVRDARMDEVDARGCLAPDSQPHGAGAFDKRSVTGICVADAGSVYCSAGAVEAMLTAGGDGTHAVSPPLFFILAHELAHIALGHPGAHSGVSYGIDLDAPTDAKLSGLATRCMVDHEQLTREQAADDEAMAELAIAFREPPFSTGFDDKTLAMIANAELAYRGARKLDEWAANFYGSNSPLLSPTAYQVCALVKSSAGRVDLPALGGDHPHSWRRLGALMKSIAGAVAALELPDDTPPAIRLAVSILRMNATTDGLRGFALDSAIVKFCRDVRDVQAKTLDCATWTPPVGLPVVNDDDLAKAGLPRAPKAVSLPLPELTPRAHHDVIGATNAQLISIQVSRDAASSARASALAEESRTQVTSLLDAIDRELSANDGFFVYLSRPPIEQDFNSFTSSYMVTDTVLGLARTPANLVVMSLPEAVLLSAHGGQVHVTSRAWAAAKYQAIMQFYADPTDSHNDSKRLLTTELPLDFFFDLEKAKGGQMGQISAAYSHLLCYARERLRAHYHADFTLHKANERQDAFYLAVREPEVNENFYFPSEWASTVTKGCPPASKTEPLVVSTLWHLFDYANHSAQVADAEFEQIFGRAR